MDVWAVDADGEEQNAVPLTSLPATLAQLEEGDGRAGPRQTEQSDAAGFLIDFRAAPDTGSVAHWLNETRGLFTVASIHSPEWAAGYASYPLRPASAFDGMAFFPTTRPARPCLSAIARIRDLPVRRAALRANAISGYIRGSDHNIVGVGVESPDLRRRGVRAGAGRSDRTSRCR